MHRSHAPLTAARGLLAPAVATTLALLLAAVALPLAGLALLPPGANAATSVWLCRPSLADDPCTTGLRTTRFSPAGAALRVDDVRASTRPAFDCFYVYPTVSDQPSIQATRRIDPEERSIALYQAARYSRDCRVYAPMYRQITLAGLADPSRVTVAVLGVLATAPRAGAATVTMFRTFTGESRLGGIAAGPDGALWFTEGASEGEDLIGRITPEGTITKFRVPTQSSDTTGIVAGPDGALWFTEGGDKIGRVTTGGAFTEFPVPTAGSGPFGIAAGADGALWFTEQRGNKIGRITTTGAITEFLLPTANSSPLAIAAGPDGALWFTEQRGNKIGRITTAGSITLFPVPSASTAPIFSPDITTGIAAGPDGALWFTEGAGLSKIGRVTTAGAITEFPVSVNSEPGGIVAGADGALWFTEQVAVKIGRLTTAGAITEFPLPIDSFPKDIALGPDGALWFVQPDGERIGRLTVARRQVSLKVAPRNRCTSSTVVVNVKTTGEEKLKVVKLLLDGKRIVRNKRRRFRVELRVRGLRPGTHMLKAVVVDRADGRATKSRTFRRCQTPNFTG